MMESDLAVPEQGPRVAIPNGPQIDRCCHRAAGHLFTDREYCDFWAPRAA